MAQRINPNTDDKSVLLSGDENPDQGTLAYALKALRVAPSYIQPSATIRIGSSPETLETEVGALIKDIGQNINLNFTKNDSGGVNVLGDSVTPPDNTNKYAVRAIQYINGAATYGTIVKSVSNVFTPAYIGVSWDSFYLADYSEKDYIQIQGIVRTLAGPAKPDNLGAVSPTDQGVQIATLLPTTTLRGRRRIFYSLNFEKTVFDKLVNNSTDLTVDSSTNTIIRNLARLTGWDNPRNGEYFSPKKGTKGLFVAIPDTRTVTFKASGVAFTDGILHKTIVVTGRNNQIPKKYIAYYYPAIDQTNGFGADSSFTIDIK